MTFLSAGINHQAFILRFERDGESLYPLLDERIDGDPELQRRVRVALYRRLGFFPTESSEHAAEYVPWFMTHDAEIERFRIPVGEYLVPQRGEPRGVRPRARRARSWRADRAHALERVRVGHREFNRDRRAVGDLRQRGERGVDRRTAARHLRRGPVPRRRHRRSPYPGPRLSAPAGGAQSHLRERGRPDRARRARRIAPTTSATPRCSMLQRLQR